MTEAVPDLRPPPRAVHRRHARALTWDVLDDGGDVLFEGAQGTLLDIDHGTYPFVTSSNPVAGAAVRRRRRRARATSTRSGASPRPTRRASAPARSRPSSTTSSARSSARPAASSAPRPAAPRRIGWLDLVALRYAARLNSLTALVVTKLDVLSGIGPLRVCTALPRRRGGALRRLPLPPVGAAPRDRRVRGAAGLGRGHHRRPRGVRPPAGRARLPRLHRRLRRRADRARRRRPRPRPDRSGPRPAARRAAEPRRRRRSAAGALERPRESAR